MTPDAAHEFGGAAAALDDAQVAQFFRDGFVRIDHAFLRALADAARAIPRLVARIVFSVGN
jgi:hypothetical protein